MYSCMDADFWLDGITCSIIVIFGVLLGPILYMRFKKTGADLIKRFSIVMPLAGLMYLGVFLDFCYCLFLGKNFPNSNGQVPILSYIWFPPLMYYFLGFLMEVLQVKNIKQMRIAIIVIAITYYILICIDPQASFYWDVPDKPGEELIDYNSELLSAAGIILAILFIPTLLYGAFLFIKKGLQSSGIIRKKFFILAGAAIAICLGGIGEGLTVPGGLLILVRISYIAAFPLLYIGLKTSE